MGAPGFVITGNPCGSMRAFLRSYRWEVSQLVCLVCARPELQLDLALATSILELQMESCSRAGSVRSLVQECISRTAIHRDHTIANLDAGTLRLAVGFNARDFRLAAEVGRCGEPAQPFPPGADSARPAVRRTGRNRRTEFPLRRQRSRGKTREASGPGRLGRLLHCRRIREIPRCLA